MAETVSSRESTTRDHERLADTFFDSFQFSLAKFENSKIAKNRFNFSGAQFCYWAGDLFQKRKVELCLVIFKRRKNRTSNRNFIKSVWIKQILNFRFVFIHLTIDQLRKVFKLILG